MRVRARVEQMWHGLVGFGFRLLYNEMAWTYDAVSWGVSLGQWRCWQRTALRHLPAPTPAPLLDLAHGTGNLHLDLLAAGYQPIGYDLSPHMGHITRRKLRRGGAPVRLVRGVAQRLPFPTGTFPTTVCTFPTPFIFEQATLSEIYRVLQPGGRVVIAMSGLLTDTTPAVAALEALYRVTGQRGGSTNGLLAPFTDAGFAARIVWETCPGSRVLLIIADKIA